MEPAPIGMQKATPVVAFSISAATSTNQNIHQTSYLPKVKSMSLKDMDAAPTTKTKSGPKRISAITCQDYAKTKCYNCN